MQCFSGDAEQHDFLAASRTLVCLLPLTAQTENSLNIDTLGRLWPGGYLSHLAGGGHLVETDLLALLGSGQLAGATLDVLSHGSLPASSLFWRHAKVTQTPHTAHRTPLREPCTAKAWRKLPTKPARCTPVRRRPAWLTSNRDTGLMKLPPRVKLVDVGPRDGLQNEKSSVPVAVKVALVHRLQAAGLKGIEVTSFVSPKRVPQMADAADVMAGIRRQTGVRYSVLTPNMQGFEAAVLSQPDEVVVFASASEAFSQRNINCSINHSMARFAPVVAAARARGIHVRGAMSCAVGCPYEGDIAPERVGHLAGLMKGIGVQHIGVADTIGVGTPLKVQRAIEATLQHYDRADVSAHFHDTYGQALANTLAALELGVWQFDTSVAGLGGCPYAKGATGNVATEDVVYLLHGMGIDTGIDLNRLVDAGVFISDFLGRKPNSRAATALLNNRSM